MSVDEIARAAARRTSLAATSATDPAAGLDDLLAMRRRRSRVTVMIGAVTAVAVLAAVWVGAGGLGRRHAEPAVPKPLPAPAKPYLAAPSICGLGGVQRDYAAAADCPTGQVPGRYLSVNDGLSTREAFALTVPAGWQVLGIPALTTGGPVIPGGGGILVRSVQTGDGIAITVAPTELGRGPQTAGTLGASARQVADWVASRPFVERSPVRRASVDGRAAWRVDLALRTGAAHGDRCLIGPGCAGVLGIWSDAVPGPGVLGAFPGGQTRMLVYPMLTGPPVVIWMWGHAGADDIDDPASAIDAVVDSLDLHPKIG